MTQSSLFPSSSSISVCLVALIAICAPGIVPAAHAQEPCPGVVRLDVDGPNSDIDPGWNGNYHDGKYVGLTLTMNISGCAGATQPTCGACTLSGPIANGGGATFNNRRCVDKTWLTCTNDGDCVAQGATGPCHIFFGPPLPYAGGGIPACVTNEITGAGSGSIHVENGTMSMNLPYLAKIYSATIMDDPCPKCVSGLCNGGPRNGFPCTPNGTSLIFADDVSFDCPPNPGQLIGTLVPSGINLSTANNVMTLTAASPNCTAPGFTSSKCFCNTCNNAAWTACSSNADCVAVGASICGGKRCLTGANNGAACTTATECPGGACSVPGAGTAPNQCNDATCSANPGDTDSTNEGVCNAGPLDQFCSLQTYRGCLSDSDCTPTAGGTCTVQKFRECFTDNGVLGASISAGGVADPPVDSVASPTLAGLVCIPPTTSSAVNQAAGFPSVGRATLPSTSTLGDEIADGTVPAGGTVTTDTENDGATPSDPLETTVTTPNAGEIILEEQAATGTPPGGFTLIGKQVNITAPTATAANPLTFVFRIDASRIPSGEDENTITVFRNNVAVANCPGSSVASPDPCVSGRQLLGDGDVQLTVKTSAASQWNFATGSVCNASPDFGCALPTESQKAQLLLKDKADDTKDLLVWKWLKGNLAYGDIGAPGSVTGFTACIYSNGALVSFGSVPAVGPWTANTTSFKYKDKTGASSGFTQLQLKSNPTPGKGKIILKGKGLNLAMPSTAGLASPVRVELHRTDSTICWAANYSAPFIKQDAEQFKDKAD